MSTYVQALSFADEAESVQEEVECKRCHGTGEDRDGADCVHCQGFGTVLV
jgi:DnaJ-class molecular chaperone